MASMDESLLVHEIPATSLEVFKAKLVYVQLELSLAAQLELRGVMTAFARVMEKLLAPEIVEEAPSAAIVPN